MIKKSEPEIHNGWASSRYTRSLFEQAVKQRDAAIARLVSAASISSDPSILKAHAEVDKLRMLVELFSPRREAHDRSVED